MKSYFEQLRAYFAQKPIKLYCLEEVDSTSTFLKQRAGQRPMLAVALRQTAGRGRLGRVWSSQGENLYASFYYPLCQQPAEALTLCVALAVSDAVEEMGVYTRIKWPNDLYVGDRKLCGILCEAIYRGAKIDGIVIGIGVNANQESFSGEAEGAVSLKNVLGHEIALAELCCRIYETLEQTLARFYKEGFGAFREEYMSRSYLQGREVVAGNLSGTCIGVSPAGDLLLRTGGLVQSVRFGEVLQRVRLKAQKLEEERKE